MRIACVQIEPRGGQDPSGFRTAVAEQLRAVGGAALFVLPELWHLGYFEFGRYQDEAETLDGPTVTAMADVALELDAYVHLGSFLERTETGALANTSVVLGPDGSVLGAYRKIHVFGYESRESELVEGGTELVVVPVGDIAVGLAICYDLRFPELFRALVDRGAEMLVIPATWPLARGSHWDLLLQARAVENLATVVGCNAAGSNGGVDLAGGSAVIGPWGDVLGRAGVEETVLVTELDLAAMRETRKRFPALEDRVLRLDLPLAVE